MTARMLAHVMYAPMNNGEYVDTDVDVYTEKEIDLPMHADLRYNAALEDDVKNTGSRFCKTIDEKGPI